MAPCGAANSGWASPPLLFGLAPRGVFRAPDVATRAVGSYPTFSPLPNALDRKRRALGFASGLPQGTSVTGGLFSVALSVAAPQRRAFAQLATQPPGVTRRVALSPPTLASSRRPESGLSSRHPSPTLRPTQGKPAITQLIRHVHYTRPDGANSISRREVSQNLLRRGLRRRGTLPCRISSRDLRRPPRSSFSC